MTWSDSLNADPLPWLLETDPPAVRAAALQALLDRPSDDPEVVAARTAAMATGQPETFEPQKNTKKLGLTRRTRMA